MQYRSHRYPTQFPVSLITASGQQQSHISDVSSSGARIAGPRNLRRGDKVKVRFLNEELSACVCWANQDQAGISFRPQITTLQVDKLRYRKDLPSSHRRGSVGFAFAEI